MFYRLKQMLCRLMYGRYGNDALGNFLFILYIVLAAVSIFTGSIILYALSLATVFLMFFRIFSRNISARSNENSKYLRFKNRFSGFFKNRHRRFKERKTHIYKKCPYCKATLRLPRKKGEHTCRCPKCNNSFKNPVR